MATVAEKIKNALTLYTTKIKSVFVQASNVVNNCTSTSTSYPLAANQGKVLQDQITELNTNLFKLNINRIQSSNVTISSGTYKGIDIDITNVNPDHTPIAISGVITNNPYTSIVGFYLTGNIATVAVRNTNSSSVTIAPFVDIVYLHSNSI